MNLCMYAYKSESKCKCNATQCMHVCLPDPMHAQVYCFDPGRHICSAWIRVYVYKICDIYIYTIFIYIYLRVCLRRYSLFKSLCRVFEGLCTFHTSCARCMPIVHVSHKLSTFHKSCPRYTQVGIVSQTRMMFMFNCKNCRTRTKYPNLHISMPRSCLHHI